MALSLVLDLEYDKLFFDSEKKKYYMYLLITHIAWYDVIIELDDSDTANFLTEGRVDREKFRKFASETAVSRPGLTYRTNPYDSKILHRTDEIVLRVEEIIQQRGSQQ